MQTYTCFLQTPITEAFLNPPKKKVRWDGISLHDLA